MSIKVDRRILGYADDRPPVEIGIKVTMKVDWQTEKACGCPRRVVDRFDEATSGVNDGIWESECTQGN
jgi:hypothetical protein